MKSIRILLGALSAIAVMSLSAYADSSIVTVYNGHGQSKQLYRNTDPTVALYAGGGTSIGTSVNPQCSQGQCKIDTIDKGHNQAVFLYRQN